MTTSSGLASRFTLSTRLLWVQKEGNTPDEYQDAAAESTDAGQFAIADGVSGPGNGSWARALVESFVHTQLDSLASWDVDEWVARLAWKCAEALGEGDVDNRPWWTDSAYVSPCSATFLGLVVTTSMDASRSASSKLVSAGWSALAVGDCCLLQVREARIVEPTPFPIADFGGFGLKPDQISASPSLRPLPKKVVGGHFQIGDQFVLATDEMARLLISDVGRAFLPRLSSLTPDRFERWVSNLRRADVVKNDDMTLLLVGVAGLGDGRDDVGDGSEPPLGRYERVRAEAVYRATWVDDADGDPDVPGALAPLAHELTQIDDAPRDVSPSSRETDRNGSGEGDDHPQRSDETAGSRLSASGGARPPETVGVQPRNTGRWSSLVAGWPRPRPRFEAIPAADASSGRRTTAGRRPPLRTFWASTLLILLLVLQLLTVLMLLILVGKDVSPSP